MIFCFDNPQITNGTQKRLSATLPAPYRAQVQPASWLCGSFVVSKWYEQYNGKPPAQATDSDIIAAHANAAHEAKGYGDLLIVDWEVITRSFFQIGPNDNDRLDLFVECVRAVKSVAPAIRIVAYGAVFNAFQREWWVGAAHGTPPKEMAAQLDRFRPLMSMVDYVWVPAGMTGASDVQTALQFLDSVPGWIAKQFGLKPLLQISSYYDSPGPPFAEMSLQLATQYCLLARRWDCILFQDYGRAWDSNFLRMITTQ